MQLREEECAQPGGEGEADGEAPGEPRGSSEGRLRPSAQRTERDSR